MNAKFLGLLRTVAGAERLLPVEHILEEMPTSFSSESSPTIRASASVTAVPASAEALEWSKICFYVTPIGEEGSDPRRHSDLFLNHVVEPAIQELKLKIVRADHICKPGMIGAQMVEHILRSRLVIADLSFHNPNVFYELCFRHVIGLPLVQIIREKDKIPFDVQQFRTIPIDNGDINTRRPLLVLRQANRPGSDCRLLGTDVEPTRDSRNCPASTQGHWDAEAQNGNASDVAGERWRVPCELAGFLLLVWGDLRRSRWIDDRRRGSTFRLFRSASQAHGSVSSPLPRTFPPLRGRCRAV